MQKIFMTEKEEYGEAEKLLESYGELVEEIDWLKSNIEDLEDEFEGCTSIEITTGSGATNKFNSIVENEIITKEDKLKTLNIKLYENLRLKKKIDRAVEKLKGVDREVIELRYINKRVLGWKEIAYTVSYSETYCRKKIKQRAIQKMAKYIVY